METKKTESIDFVVTWVDGSDPLWRNEKNQYATLDQYREFAEDSGEERYRDWGLLKYWFRAVETYAPWVRRVHFVTWGHLPEWLNLHCPKLNVITHEAFIPQEYLPTFNCNAIELNLHRIPGLAEHFVYFNDDVYITGPVVPEDYFFGDLPNQIPLRKAFLTCSGDAFRQMEYRTLDLANHLCENYFGTHETGRLSLGVHFHHLGAPLRKSTMMKTWSRASQSLDTTCKRRFRTANDVTLRLFSLVEHAEGNEHAVDKKHFGKVFAPERQINQIIAAIIRKQDRMICINDTKEVSNAMFGYLQSELNRVFEHMFPEKSSYEI